MQLRLNAEYAANPQPGIGLLQQKLSDRLAEVLRRALISTGGSGAAIALKHGDGMVTRARAGSAPDLGSKVNIHGSFAGLCVRTGRTLRSDHLETDPRANGAAWRALNVSSMVVTPVRKGDAVVGVLAVFSHRPHAFSPSHGAALEILALVLDTTAATKQSPPPPPQCHITPRTEHRVEPPTPKEPPQLPEATFDGSPAVPPQPTAAAEVAPEQSPALTVPAMRPQVAVVPWEATPVRPVSPEPKPVAASVSSAAATKKVETPHILRFHKSERMLHWSIAIPFLVCFASALILVIFYNPHPQRAHRMAFSLLHRISGMCLMVFPALTALRNRSDHRIHFYNIKEAFTWVRDDVKWLMLMGAAALSSKVALPEQGKFNAAEKLNFIMVMCTYPLFIVTGGVLWRLHVPVAAWMVHVGMAAMAAPLVAGHIFMATINPETRVGLSGMLTGYVDRHWARHHYTRWYREHFEAGHARDKHVGEERVRRQPPLVPCPSEAEP